MNKDSKIFVAGHRGLVGSAILKNLKAKGYTNFVLRTHAELDLTDQQAVHDFFAAEKPEYVFLAAAHVGGIVANSRYRADFIYENLMIQNNVIHASYLNNVKKLLFLGSTCIYPGNAPQPMPEDCLLTSPLEYSNEPYAIAKIAGIKMCESYNLQYGNADAQTEVGIGAAEHDGQQRAEYHGEHGEFRHNLVRRDIGLEFLLFHVLLLFLLYYRALRIRTDRQVVQREC